MRASRSPTTVMTANGEVQTREEATVYVKQLDLFVKIMLLEETPAVLSLVKLCEDQGFSYHWISGQNPHLIRSGKRTDCKKPPTMCHFWFLVYQRVLPQLRIYLFRHHLHHRSQHRSTVIQYRKNRGVEAPASERSRGMNEELRGDPLHESTETENKIKIGNPKKYKEI